MSVHYTQLMRRPGGGVFPYVRQEYQLELCSRISMIMLTLVCAGGMGAAMPCLAGTSTGPLGVGCGIFTLMTVGMVASLYRQWRRGRNIDPLTANRIIHKQLQRDVLEIQQLQNEILYLQRRRADAEALLPREG